MLIASLCSPWRLYTWSWCLVRMCCVWCHWCPGCSLRMLSPSCLSLLFLSAVFSPCGLMLGWQWMLVAFSYFARRSWTGCLAFVFFLGLFCFISRSLDARMRAHSHFRSHARSPSHLRACIFLLARMGFPLFPTFLPPFFLVARLSPILEGLLAFGGGWGSDSTPSGGCGWAVLGAFVFVLCVLVGWA